LVKRDRKIFSGKSRAAANAAFVMVGPHAHIAAGAMIAGFGMVVEAGMGPIVTLVVCAETRLAEAEAELRMGRQ
jgi:hypothetical protein